ncbi:hypothetical protein IWX49DRAFT_226665 [Phyllosticta citricarpa]|uniref:Uncharacterized protein n=1 Tax=Phyllosticta paracitricarpa TaxID=2016321 RepID=A0ABR1MXA8_9PEZI
MCPVCGACQLPRSLASSLPSPYVPSSLRLLLLLLHLLLLLPLPLLLLFFPCHHPRRAEHMTVHAMRQGFPITTSKSSPNTSPPSTGRCASFCSVGSARHGLSLPLLASSPLARRPVQPSPAQPVERAAANFALQKQRPRLCEPRGLPCVLESHHQPCRLCPSGNGSRRPCPPILQGYLTRPTPAAPSTDSKLDYAPFPSERSPLAGMTKSISCGLV